MFSDASHGVYDSQFGPVHGHVHAQGGFAWQPSLYGAKADTIQLLNFATNMHNATRVMCITHIFIAFITREVHVYLHAATTVVARHAVDRLGSAVAGRVANCLASDLGVMCPARITAHALCLVVLHDADAVLVAHDAGACRNCNNGNVITVATTTSKL